MVPLLVGIMAFWWNMVRTSKGCYTEVIVLSLHEAIMGPLRDKKMKTCVTILDWFYDPIYYVQ